MKNETIRNHYDAYLRINAFNLKYGARFSPGGLTATLFGELAALIPDMDRLGVGQLEGSTDYHSGTSAKQEAAEQLRGRLRRLRDTARTVGRVEKDAQFADPFRLPRTRAFAPLLTQAKLALAAAQPLAARLTQLELPAGFLEALEIEIAEFEQAVGDQDAGLSTQVGGTAGLVALINRGMELRLQLLPLVRNKFQSDPSIAAEWETATRIVRVKRSTDVEKAAKVTEPR